MPAMTRCAALGLIALVLAGCATTPAVPLTAPPVVEGEWGYRPADGAVPAMNPPGFTWRPDLEAKSYAVQVAKDAAFRHLVYQKNDCAWSAHCPNAAFAPGAYHWRYTVQYADGKRSAWSESRAFTVEVKAVVAPQPDHRALAQSVVGARPLLFFRAEDLPDLRTMANGPLADRWKDLQRSADEILANPPDLAEPPMYPTGMKIDDAGWKEIWWGNRGRVIAVADGAATLAFAYRIGGDEKYALAARDLMLALTKWDPEGATQYEYNDEAAMPFLYYVARAYSWTYPVLSESDRKTIATMMRIRGQQCYKHLQFLPHLWKPYSSHSNRAWHFLGETALAFYNDIPEAPMWLDYTMTVMYTTYPVWGDDRGGWHEGTGYWASYLERFVWWSTICESAFGVHAFDRPFFQRTGYYGMYCVPPESNTGGFGDMGRDVTARRSAPLLLQLAVGAKNPHWYWYAQQEKASFNNDYLGFLYAARAAGMKAKPPTDLPSSACFDGVGIAALNSDLSDGRKNVQVLFKSSPFGRQSHGYNANNAFILNIGGEEALCPSGKRDVHGSKHHMGWMWTSRSDNAILVNGKGQIKHSPLATGRISAFETSDTVDVVVGEAEKSYDNLKRWTRRIIFIKPDIIVIHDVLDAPELSTFQYCLHAPGQFTLGDGEATWSGKAGAFRAQFVEPTGLVLSQNNQFDPPPAEWADFKLNDWHLTADAQEKTTHREFITVIAAALGKEVPAMPAVRRDANPDGGYTLSFPVDKGPVTMNLKRDTFDVSAPGFVKAF